ncbi:hypothetical protein K474DRAFT_1426148 [Panus rudis PR-1116 ss-1]|nr:hypothetical protein K474DRAFT_1426148 [Panus rudis PR-1116 ss-1]
MIPISSMGIATFVSALDILASILFTYLRILDMYAHILLFLYRDTANEKAALAHTRTPGYGTLVGTLYKLLIISH